MSELPEETGDARVDAIVGGLARLGELPVSDHVAVFGEAFSGLEATLAAAGDDDRSDDRPDDRPENDRSDGRPEDAVQAVHEQRSGEQALGRP
jgi:hypothetical protein